MEARLDALRRAEIGRPLRTGVFGTASRRRPVPPAPGHEAVARTARSVFPAAEQASDEPTADRLTQRLTIHEKTAWMLRSLLEG